MKRIKYKNLNDLTKSQIDELNKILIKKISDELVSGGWLLVQYCINADNDYLLTMIDDKGNIIDTKTNMKTQYEQYLL